MNRLLNLVNQSKRMEFLANVSTFGAGRFISQLITLLSIPILTRVYGAQAFGVWAILEGGGYILSSIYTGGFERAIIYPRDDGESYSILLKSIIIAFGALLIFELIMFLPLQWQHFSFFHDYHQWRFMIPVIAFLVAVVAIFIQWGNRFKMYKTIAASQISRAIFIPLVAVVTVSIIPDTGIALANIVGLVLVNVILIVGLRVGKIAPKKVKLSSLSDFYQYGVFSSIFQVMSKNLPVILIGAFWGIEYAGIYLLADKILAAPSLFVGESIYHVFNRMVVQEGNWDKIWYKSKKLALSLLIIGFLPMLICVFWGEAIFTFLFGAKWGLAGQTATVLVLLYFLHFIIRPFFSYLILTRQMRYDTFLNAIHMSFQIVGLIIGLPQGYLSGIIGMLIGGIAGQVMTFITLRFIVKINWISKS